MPDLDDLKQTLRRQALANRNDQASKDQLSRAIFRSVTLLPEYEAAGWVLCYIDARSEVRTRHDLPAALAGPKRFAVPYCLDGRLLLVGLENMDDLSRGSYNILEPRPELRGRQDRHIDIRQIDLVMVPGVAFDRSGGRLGHGFGYYDKLLAQARPDTTLVALAFECQLFPKVPTQPHDIAMHKIVTEQKVYEAMKDER